MRGANGANEQNRYNKQKNKHLWEHNKGCLGMKYLVRHVAKAGRQSTYLPRYKPYPALRKGVAHVKVLPMTRRRAYNSKLPHNV